MVHIHAEGPAFFAWLPKMFGKRVVVTVHGIDWQREKWQSGLGSKFIHQGEKNAAKYADEVIVLSKGVQDYFKESVNYNYPLVDTDYIFLSNLRRFRELDASNREKCIVTSNIPADNVYLQTKYRDLLCDIEAVKDNAGLMAIKFFAKMGVKKIYLAGFEH